MIDLYELFKSVELITDAKINEFRSTSDKTIEATIISIDRQKYGEYTVQYESTKLIVHSADMSYGLGDEVYVGIPAGSYNSAYIIAKKIKPEQASNHTNPFQDFVEMDSKNNTTVISTTNMFDNPSTVLLFDSAYTTLEKYSHLGLSVTLNSAVGDLSRFKNVQYGLSLHIITAAQLGVTGEKINRSHVFNFDSSEFIGNPFNFVNDVTQYKVLDIDSINNIEQIKIYGYCFLDDDAKKYLDTTQDFVHNFLHFISVKLSLGYHMSAINEEGLYLYTDGPLSYGAVIDDHQKKKLLLRWVYKQNNKLVVVTQKNFDTLFPDNASLTWQHKTNDQWVDLTPPEKGFIFDVGPLDLYRPVEEYRAIVLYANFDSDAPQEFGSNILTFENKNTKRSNLIIDNSMVLSADQNDYSMYYGPDGIILDPGQAKLPQCIKCSAGLEAEIKNIDDVVSVDIIWKIPHYTMIQPYGFVKDKEENMSQYAEYNADYQQFRKTIVTSNQVKDLSTLLKTEFYFTIRDFYSPDYGNNKIECEIQVVRATDTGLQILQKDSQSCTLSFAKSGLCKTDKVIQLTMYNERNNPVRAICPGETLIIKAIVYDCNGSPLTLTEPIKWSWWCAAGNSKEDAEWDEDTKSWSQAEAFLSARTTGENTCEIVASSWPQGEETIVNSNGTLTKGLCYILQASYIQGNSTIVGQLPIGINFAPNQVNYVCGPTQVLYGVEGGNPTYYNVKYQAYNFSNIALPNWSWAGYVHTREQGLTSAEEGYYDGYPKIHSNNDEEYMLCPNTTFLKDANSDYCVIGYTGSSDNKMVQWVQPILITQYNMSSSFLADWDGSLQLKDGKDGDVSSVLAGRLGAGRKNSSNQFSGVMLGDLKAGGIDLTGIYGFDKDALSYGFCENGTAFLGKATSGRIHFDGNEGVIQSANFNGVVYKSYGEIDSFSLEHVGVQLKVNDSFNVLQTAASGSNSPESLWPLFINPPSSWDDRFDDKKIAIELELQFTVSDNLVPQCFYMRNSWSDDVFCELVVNEKRVGYDLDLDNPINIFNNTRLKLKIILNGVQTAGLYFYDPSATTVPNGTFLCKILSSKVQIISKTPQSQHSANNEDTDTNISSGVFVLSTGSSGTYMNLKDGQLITNSGYFRGHLQAESLDVLNKIIIGKVETGKYLEIDPEEGVALGDGIFNDNLAAVQYTFDDSVGKDTILSLLKQWPHYLIYTSTNLNNSDYGSGNMYAMGDDDFIYSWYATRQSQAAFKQGY